MACLSRKWRVCKTGLVTTKLVCFPLFDAVVDSAGSQARTDGCQVAASVTVDVLYVVLMGCKQWLQSEGTQSGDQVQGFTSAIRSLDGHLTAQLNAGACLTHLLILVGLVADCDVTGLQSHINPLSEIKYCPCSPPIETNTTPGDCLLCMLQKGPVYLKNKK